MAMAYERVETWFEYLDCSFQKHAQYYHSNESSQYFYSTHALLLHSYVIFLVSFFPLMLYWWNWMWNPETCGLSYLRKGECSSRVIEKCCVFIKSDGIFVENPA